MQRRGLKPFGGRGSLLSMPSAVVPVPVVRRTYRDIWTCGSNFHIDKLPADKVSSFKPTGNLREDYLNLSTACGVVAPSDILAGQRL